MTHMVRTRVILHGTSLPAMAPSVQPTARSLRRGLCRRACLGVASDSALGGTAGGHPLLRDHGVLLPCRTLPSMCRSVACDDRDHHGRSCWNEFSIVGNTLDHAHEIERAAAMAPQHAGSTTSGLAPSEARIHDT